MKLSWNWLKDYVAIKKMPQEVAERLTMAGLEVKKVEKIDGDYLLETEVTSNRPDWLSHIGVAREIAANYNLSLQIPPRHLTKIQKTTRTFHIETPDRALCPYYSAVVLENVGKVQTPEWMEKRLRICGIRSISFLVDMTNYVLLEWGQPLHAFDLDRLRGEAITARRAKPNEKIVVIDNTTYELLPDDIVIADGSGPVALGGVMGGKSSEVSTETKHVLLESAFFSPSSIRKTSKRLKLFSESSYRFERGVDPDAVDAARNRAANLILEYAGVGVLGPALASGKLPVSSHRIVFPFKKVQKVLGPVSIPIKKAKAILNDLEISTKIQGQKLICKTPSFRADISAEEDLVEEIARIHGYDKIPETLPIFHPAEPVIDPILEIGDRARDLCVGLGLQEIITFSLVDPAHLEGLVHNKNEWVAIENPRNQHLTLMRPALISNFLEVIKRNLNQGANSVAIFEVGNRYLDRGKSLPDEERMLTIALAGGKPSGWLDAKRSFEWYDLKGMVSVLLERLRSVKVYTTEPLKEGGDPFYLPSQAFHIRVQDHWLGSFGAVQLDVCRRNDIEKPVFYAEISLAELSKIKKADTQYQEIPRFPSVERDVALVVGDDVQGYELRKYIESLGRRLIQKIELFDLYRGGKLPRGKKSIAFRINYQSKVRTLEASEVNELHFSIVEALNQKFYAELPSKESQSS